MIEKYKLILGDCLQKMKELPSESVDAVITDPPYNVLSEIQAWDDKGDDDKFLDFTKKWMSEAYRVAKPNSVCLTFFGQNYLKEFLNLETEWTFSRQLIWHHPNLAKPTRKMYLWTYDPIFFLKKGKPKMDAHFCSGENVDVFRYAKPQCSFNGENYRFHPCSKPIKLMEKLIAPHTKKGSIVLDPFMGSGTTGVACANLGRRFIGIELVAEYFKIAEARVGEAYKQKKLWQFAELPDEKNEIK